MPAFMKPRHDCLMRTVVQLGLILLLSTSATAGHAGLVVTTLPESSLPTPAGETWGSGFKSTSADPTAVFNGEAVNFWGFSNGGSVENIPLEPGVRRPFLIARWRLDFDSPTTLYSLTLTGAGDHRELSQLRLLDANRNALGSKPLVGSNSLRSQTLDLDAGFTGTTFYVDAYDYSRDIRFVAGIALNTTAPFVQGDVDLDGRVDLVDFGILKAHFGKPGTLFQGDVNEDGSVNLSDYGVIKANFGQGAAVVPEPATAVLVGVSLLLLGLRYSYRSASIGSSLLARRAG